MVLQARIRCLVVVSGRSLVFSMCLDNADIPQKAYPKSKSSTPNLLYLISTFLYIGGASVFMLSSAVLDAWSECCWVISAAAVSPDDMATSRAFSLKNLGGWMLLEARLACLVSSAWFLRKPLVFGPQSPHSIGFNPARNEGSNLTGGDPTSDTICGHAEARTSR